jgi:hypothetical protein
MNREDIIRMAREARGYPAAPTDGSLWLFSESHLERFAALVSAAEPVQEPVAYIQRNEYNEYRLEPHDNFDIKNIPFNVDVLLYTSPLQRQPLTDEEIKHAWYEACKIDVELTAQLVVCFARAIEAAHGIKEKNT